MIYNTIYDTKKIYHLKALFALELMLYKYKTKIS